MTTPEQTKDLPLEPATSPSAEPQGTPAEGHGAAAIPPAPPVHEHSSVGARLRRFLWSLSVRTKIAGTVIVILGVAVVSLGIVTFARQSAILRSEMRSRAETLVHQLAGAGKEGLLTRLELPVVSAISDITKQEDIVYAMVIDLDGRVFAHSDLARKGALLTASNDLASLRADGLLFQEIKVGRDTVQDVTMPIKIKAQNLKLGTARIGISQRALNEAIGRQQRTYLWMALGFIVVGLAGSLFISRLITKPLDTLSAGIQVVSRGDLRKLVPVSSEDEIGKVTGAFNQMILSLREKLLMEKYLSQSTVLNIKEHRDVTQLKLGGERKYVTALFSDARGFTSLSEKMSPEDVVRLMNIYLNLQTTVVHQRGGIVDKFVGDEVMAIFEGHGMEINAARAAVEIQSYCKVLNAAREAAGEKTVNIGIGLNSGEVVMGNMGSEEHMDYTVIGDSINVAARLCGAAQPGQVLVSRATAEQIGAQATWKDLPPVMVKGKDHPIGIVEPVAVKGGSRRYLRKVTDFEVTYSLEGFADETQNAVVRNICAGGCLLETATPIGIGSKVNIAMNLVDVGKLEVRAEVYHARRQDDLYLIGLCFEGLPVDVQHRMALWIHQVNTEIVQGLFL
jgi:class 3 adenylate cyclase